MYPIVNGSTLSVQGDRLVTSPAPNTINNVKGDKAKNQMWHQIIASESYVHRSAGPLGNWRLDWQKTGILIGMYSGQQSGLSCAVGRDLGYD